MPDDVRPYHHGDLRNALVLAGIALLDEEGLGALSLRAIAGRVGVSHTAPKNHFGSLMGLTTAIAAEGFRRHAAFMREGVEGAEATREARLRAAAEGYVRFALAHPHLFALMFSNQHRDRSDPELREAGRGSYAVLEGVAEGLDWDGAAGEGGARRSETMLWSVVHGYALLRLAGQLDRHGDAGPPGIAEVMPAFGYRA